MGLRDGDLVFLTGDCLTGEFFNTLTFSLEVSNSTLALVNSLLSDLASSSSFVFSLCNHHKIFKKENLRLEVRG